MLKRLSGQNYFGNGVLYMPGEYYIFICRLWALLDRNWLESAIIYPRPKKVKEEMKIEKNERMILKRKNNK